MKIIPIMKCVKIVIILILTTTVIIRKDIPIGLMKKIVLQRRELMINKDELINIARVEEIALQYHKDRASVSDEDMQKFIDYFTDFVNREINAKHDVHDHRRDIQQTAMFRLFVCLDKYDPTKKNKFITYAISSLKGEIMKYMHQYVYWDGKLSRAYSEQFSKLRKHGIQTEKEQKKYDFLKSIIDETIFVGSNYWMEMQEGYHNLGEFSCLLGEFVELLTERERYVLDCKLQKKSDRDIDLSKSEIDSILLSLQEKYIRYFDN